MGALQPLEVHVSKWVLAGKVNGSPTGRAMSVDDQTNPANPPTYLQTNPPTCANRGTVGSAGSEVISESRLPCFLSEPVVSIQAHLQSLAHPLKYDPRPK